MLKEFPYTVCKIVWDDYYKMQMSGRMNMMGYPTVELFIRGRCYEKAFEHFETNQKTEDLVMLNAY